MGKVTEVQPNKKASTVFLAGTIDMGNSENWQKEIIEFAKELEQDITFYNPRRDGNTFPEGEIDYQINWELDHLEECDYIFMNLEETSKSPISLMELGLFARSGKLVVCCPKGFYRYDNVRLVCERYDVPLFNNKPDFYKHLAYETSI